MYTAQAANVLKVLRLIIRHAEFKHTDSAKRLRERLTDIRDGASAIVALSDPEEED